MKKFNPATTKTTLTHKVKTRPRGPRFLKEKRDPFKKAKKALEDDIFS